jgi:hypothetical protein
MSILDQFFSDNNQPLDAEHIRHCREMAESLLSTVSVVQAHNEHGESEDFDPLFLAINSLIGRIVEDAIKLALRDRMLQGDVDFVEPQWLLTALSDLLATMPQTNYCDPWISLSMACSFVKGLGDKQC